MKHVCPFMSTNKSLVLPITFVVALSASFTLTSLAFISIPFSCATLADKIDAVAPKQNTASFLCH